MIPNLQDKFSMKTNSKATNRLTMESQPPKVKLIGAAEVPWKIRKNTTNTISIHIWEGYKEVEQKSDLPPLLHNMGQHITRQYLNLVHGPRIWNT